MAKIILEIEFVLFILFLLWFMSFDTIDFAEKLTSIVVGVDVKKECTEIAACSGLKMSLTSGSKTGCFLSTGNYSRRFRTFELRGVAQVCEMMGK